MGSLDLLLSTTVFAMGETVDEMSGLAKCSAEMSDAGSWPELSLFSFFPTTPMGHFFLEHLIDVFMISLKLPLSVMKVLRICPKGSGKLLSPQL